MDFLWFWVSVGLAVEVVRQSYKHCTPNKPKTQGNSLEEPLLQEDGSCPYSCCTKEVLDEFETDYGASTSDDGETYDALSSDEIEEFTESLIDKRKGKRLAAEYEGIGEIVGTLYPGGGGGPKLVHFKWADNYFEASQNDGARVLKREGSAKVHPQPLNETENGTTAEEVHGSKDNSSPELAKDIKRCVAPRALSDEYTLVPPIQEVMHHGHIPSGEEIQPAEGTKPSPDD